MTCVSGSVCRYAVAVPAGLAWIVLALVVRASTPATSAPPQTLPATATRQLANSLALSASAPSHVWRDVPPFNASGTVNVYIEIARGDLRKWEFDMRLNARAVDRVMPPDLGYPVNYGFVPQTISYDGDPFDALVLGPALEGGALVRGVIVGLLHMTDEKGLDSKVALSMFGSDRRPTHDLTDADQQRIADYFSRYKRHEQGKFSIVHGWDTRAQGRAFIQTTHAFFRECRREPGSPCSVSDHQVRLRGADHNHVGTVPSEARR
jgi:inorganic pyrophosphatase